MAESGAKLEGLNKVLKNLNKEIKKIKGRSLKGLIRAQIIVRRDMEFTPPMIPIDTSNLTHSYFTITSKGNIEEGKSPAFKGERAAQMASDHSAALTKFKAVIAVPEPALILGFSAFYAAFVHENYGAHFQKDGAGAGFLKAALNNNKHNILKMIAHEARIR